MKAAALMLAMFAFVEAGGDLAWGETHDRVWLPDIQVLTLTHGKMTTGRRSSPVKQIKCVGECAQGQFKPSVVQCYNRGGDGRDVQWECKSDMDNSFRFGDVEVVCEGFDYPEDPHILAGSCALQYTLDLTMEGRIKKEKAEMIANLLALFIVVLDTFGFSAGLNRFQMKWLLNFEGFCICMYLYVFGFLTNHLWLTLFGTTIIRIVIHFLEFMNI